MAENAHIDTGPRRGRLDAVVRRYYAPLLTFFRKRTSNPSEVEDLVQQVFYRLSNQSDADIIRDPDAYIFRTAANTLRDYRRRAAVRDRLIEPYGPLAEHEDSAVQAFSPERLLLGKEAVQRVEQVLRGLPERTRDVFVLRCLEGLKHAEIARLQGISVRAVEKHAAKALAAVSQVLQESES
jgi:RNA polymerase sigma factor (sigma-70 family)